MGGGFDKIINMNFLIKEIKMLEKVLGLAGLGAAGYGLVKLYDSLKKKKSIDEQIVFLIGVSQVFIEKNKELFEDSKFKEFEAKYQLVEAEVIKSRSQTLFECEKKLESFINYYYKESVADSEYITKINAFLGGDPSGDPISVEDGYYNATTILLSIGALKWEILAENQKAKGKNS